MKEQKFQGLTNHKASRIQGRPPPPHQLFDLRNTALETYGTLTSCKIKEKLIQRSQFDGFWCAVCVRQNVLTAIRTNKSIQDENVSKRRIHFGMDEI